MGVIIGCSRVVSGDEDEAFIVVWVAADVSWVVSIEISFLVICWLVNIDWNLVVVDMGYSCWDVAVVGAVFLG